jgi:Fur family transcriptional regulator, ferric uptake regulator
MSRQRNAVREELLRDPAFRSAQEIHASLRSSGHRIGLTTVYRALQALTDADEVDVLRKHDGEVTYRACSAGHHHHVVCRRCGTTVEVEGRAVETWAERVAREHGFVDVAHTVEVVGTCRRCAARRPGP